MTTASINHEQDEIFRPFAGFLFLCYRLLDLTFPTSCKERTQYCDSQ